LVRKRNYGSEELNVQHIDEFHDLYNLSVGS